MLIQENKELSMIPNILVTLLLTLFLYSCNNNVPDKPSDFIGLNKQQVWIKIHALSNKKPSMLYAKGRDPRLKKPTYCMIKAGGEKNIRFNFKISKVWKWQPGYENKRILITFDDNDTVINIDVKSLK
jgi:hypothetical protein